MDPAEIDITFVPVLGVGLHPIEAGSELLVLDEHVDQVHLLSPTASLVWSFADGRGTLADFATDLVDELGADPDQVTADLVGLAADLVERGLWRDVRDNHHPPTPPVAPGSGIRLVAGRADPGLVPRFPAGRTHLLTLRHRSVELDLRIDDAELADELGQGLVDAGLEVERRSARPVRRAPPLYSVLVGRRSGPVTGLHLLRRADRPVRRCRHRQDLVRIVVAEMVAALDRESGRRPLLDAVGLARDGSLVAVDPLFASVVDDLEPRLRHHGISRADASLLVLPPDEPSIELEALVLRPAADPSLVDPGVAPEARAARVTVRAVDLARGPAGRLAAGTIERLYQVALTTRVVRAPGRGALLDEVMALLT